MFLSLCVSEKERNDCLEEQVAEHRLAEDKHLKEKNHLTEERDHLKTIVKELRTFAQQRDQTLLGDIGNFKFLPVSVLPMPTDSI